MNSISRTAVAVAAAVAIDAALCGNAHAYRMIQNTSTGRSSFGTPVSCSDPVGFAHWAASGISYSYATTNQGGEPGVANALRSAMSSWSNVPSGGHTLTLAGTTNAGFATDGINAIHWAT